MNEYIVIRVWKCTDAVVVSQTDERLALGQANLEGTHPIQIDQLYDSAQPLSEEWEVHLSANNP